MSNIIKIRNKLPLKNKKILIILVIIIAVLGLISWAFISTNGEKINQIINNGKNDNTNKKTVSSDITDAIDNIEELKKQSDSTGDITALEENQKKLQEYVNNSSNNDAKLLYLNESFLLYINNEMEDSALEIANQAEKIKPIASTASNLALVYMKMGSYQEAVEYYQLAADRSEKSDNPNESCPYNDYLIAKRNAEALIK